MKMKDLDSMDVEKIIRLPFFHSLEKSIPNAQKGEVNTLWKITFRCNRILAEGLWGLLDHESETEYVIRYKLIDFK